jgi:hypothetical protein
LKDKTINNLVVKNGFDTAVLNQPVGDRMNWVKTQFLRSGSPVALGTVFVALMPTLESGSIGWLDQKINYLNKDFVSRIGIPPVEDGRSPYTSLELIDEAGSVLTFTSSSWGGRNCCTALIPQYRQMGLTMLPVIYLSSKPRINQYGTGTDPVFAVKDWAPRSRFAAILGPEEIETKAIAAPAPDMAAESKAQPTTKKKATDELNDEIPW